MTRVTDGQPDDILDSCAALVRVLPWVMASLVALGAVAAVCNAPLQQTALTRSVFACLHLDQESSIATWFSSSTLLLGALMSGHIALRHRHARTRDSLAWATLALGVGALSMDEIVGLHERLGNAVARVVPVGTFGTFAWIIPGAAVVGLGTLVLLRFLLRQERWLRRALLVAGFCYFGGAIGFEAIGGVIYAHLGKESWPFELSVLCEEGLEMLGAVLLLRATLAAARTTLRMHEEIGEPMSRAAEPPQRALQAVGDHRPMSQPACFHDPVIVTVRFRRMFPWLGPNVPAFTDACIRRALAGRMPEPLGSMLLQALTDDLADD